MKSAAWSQHHGENSANPRIPQTVQVSLGSLTGLLRVHGCEPGQKMFPVHFRTHSVGIWRGFDTNSLAQFRTKGSVEEC